MSASSPSWVNADQLMRDALERVGYNVANVCVARGEDCEFVNFICYAFKKGPVSFRGPASRIGDTDNQKRADIGEVFRGHDFVSITHRINLPFWTGNYGSVSLKITWGRR